MALIILVTIILSAAAAAYFLYPRLGIVSGFAAKNLCSAFYLAGRDGRSVAAGENAIFPVRYARAVIMPEARAASASVFGLGRRTAVYTEGAGCLLLPEDLAGNPPPHYAPTRRRFQPPAARPPESPAPGAAGLELEEAVAAAFDGAGKWRNRTAAVVVLRGGRIVAERYAPGFGPGTRLAGWSMTKSLTAAVCGVLAGEGRLDLERRGLFGEWMDGRARITVNQLLQMSSGLAWAEDYTSDGDVTGMLYRAADMGAVQRGKPLAAEPGTKWNYSSGTTNLLSAFLRGLFASHQEYLDFWYEGLADRIGMDSLVLETDRSGTYVGSSYGWATAADWAKLGQLYLNKGVWGGRQVLAPGWADYTARPAPGSGGAYGAHFWLNAGGKFPGAPADLYYCGGYQGQYVFIVPSKDAVIVRLGLSGRHFAAAAFLKGILAAL